MRADQPLSERGSRVKMKSLAVVVLAVYQEATPADASAVTVGAVTR